MKRGYNYLIMSDQNNEDSELKQIESVSEGLGTIEGAPFPMDYIGPDDDTAIHPEDANNVLETSELTNTINFGDDNTRVMTIENMIDLRYKEFNKALMDLATLVDMYSADKKTVKYIKAEYLKIYEKYFDVIKYMYGLDIEDTSIKPGVTADRIIYKREVVDPKRVVLPNGQKLHIYQNKDGKYQFIDELFIGGVGPSLYDLAFWIENRDMFTDNYICLENCPISINIFGRSAYIPIKGLRIPRSGNIMAERFYAILSRLHKQLGEMLMEHKKNSNTKTHIPTDSDEDDEDLN